MVDVNELTPEQRALISEYQASDYPAKWGRIIRSRRPIDRSLATAGIQDAYTEIGCPLPEIQFFDSPIAATRWVEDCDQLGPFMTQFDLSASIFNLTTFILNQQSPLGTPQNLANTPIVLLFDPALSAPRMQSVATAISKPLLHHITQLAQSQNQMSPLAPIGNHFTGKLAQGIGKSIVFNQQQALRRSILEQPWGEFFVQTGDKLWQTLRPVTQPIETELEKVRTQVTDELWKQLQSQPQAQAWQTQLSHFWKTEQLDQVYGGMIDWLPIIDFSVVELKQDFGIQHWGAIVKLMQECCWVYPFEKVCLVVDRPNSYVLDADRSLHSEGEPAILFRDGYAIYA